MHRLSDKHPTSIEDVIKTSNEIRLAWQRARSKQPEHTTLKRIPLPETEPQSC